MGEGPPRRHIDELLTRWTLTRLRLVVVEGPTDQRLLRLVQCESYCDPALKDVDVWPVEAVEVPAVLVQKHGIAGNGAKQRVIAFAREIDAAAQADGFRGVVDKDLDPFLGIDFRSASVLYTDHGCMDAYLWTVDVLRRLIIQFKCDGKIETARDVRGLFSGIGASCADLAAVRIAAAQHPEWELKLHHSDKALNTSEKAIEVDLTRYVEQCAPVKGCLNDAKAHVADVRAKLKEHDPLDLLNGHDLLWLVTYALKAFTAAPRRLVHEENVAGALVALGVMNTHLTNHGMFQALSAWASPAKAAQAAHHR